MDPLRRHEIKLARSTPREEKAKQAFDLFRTGIRLKRTGLRARHPDASEKEIEGMIDAWLRRDV